jgi:hypothetical protein
MCSILALDRENSVQRTEGSLEEKAALNWTKVSLKPFLSLRKSKDSARLIRNKGLLRLKERAVV